MIVVTARQTTPGDGFNYWMELTSVNVENDQYNICLSTNKPGCDPIDVILTSEEIERITSKNKVFLAYDFAKNISEGRNNPTILEIHYTYYTDDHPIKETVDEHPYWTATVIDYCDMGTDIVKASDVLSCWTSFIQIDFQMIVFVDNEELDRMHDSCDYCVSHPEVRDEIIKRSREILKEKGYEINV